MRVGGWQRTVVGIVGGLLVAACSSGGESPLTTTTTRAPESTTPAGSVTTLPATTTPGTPPVTAPASSVPPSTVPVPRYVDENGFDDHTVPRVDTVGELLAMSRLGVGGQTALKFTIPEFDRPADAADAADLARVHLMDGNFYSLHDEWYYYRLLNGQPVPGSDAVPVVDQRFDTVAEIYRWARATRPSDLPLGLRFFDDRLYSSSFYDLALHGDPRAFGVGAVVRFADPVAGQPDHWMIELEYTDVVDPQIVAQFFERLAPVLPDEVASRLEWVVRSPQQEAVARQMIAEQLPYSDRIVHYRDLVPAGTVAVYSEGVIAGKLLYVGEGGAELGDAKPGDIIVTEHVPDWLPQASALITSDPQTPLAHVNLLARNRAMPNASQAGIVDDAGLRQAARVRAHAIVIARGSTLQIALISRQQYDAWMAAQRPSLTSVTPVDSAAMPLMLDLTELVARLSEDGLTEEEIAAWRPVLGGKSAGFLTLLSTPGLTPPPDPLAITVSPYVEHLAPLRTMIEGAITDDDLSGSPRALWLVLEGDGDYAEMFPTDEDSRFAIDFLEAHPEGTPLGDVIAAGGVRQLIEDRPIAPVTLSAITEVLASTYADYDSAAGLRFRSSSSVEDIEGFNGAGLYTSYTGYLDPESLDDPDDRDNTIERAILRAWSSYWSFEAFQERQLSGIDHLSGAMGLTVHARFDDELELNNGVATLTYLPGGADDDAVVEINVQAGSVEVTNPDPDDIQLPEVIRVTREDGELTIERVSGSTLAKPNQPVMDDAAVRQLFGQVSAVADVWRTRVNAGLPAAQRLQTVVLDYEFKTMDAGWPRLVDGSDQYPSRLVLRQVRSLDPGTRQLSNAVRTLPIPRDVLVRAAVIETIRCESPDGSVTERIEVLTDPLLVPDVGYSEQPLMIGPPSPSDATCIPTTRYASPRQDLLALVESGEAFVIIG